MVAPSGNGCDCGLTAVIAILRGVQRVKGVRGGGEGGRKIGMMGETDIGGKKNEGRMRLRRMRFGSKCRRLVVFLCERDLVARRSGLQLETIGVSLARRDEMRLKASKDASKPKGIKSNAPFPQKDLQSCLPLVTNL